MRIGRRDIRNDSDQMGRILAGGPPLHPAEIGSSNHPHLSVAPRLGSQPLDSALPVLGLVPKRNPGPAGFEPAPAVLNRARISSTSPVLALQFHHLFAIRRT